MCFSIELQEMYFYISTPIDNVIGNIHGDLLTPSISYEILQKTFIKGLQNYVKLLHLGPLFMMIEYIEIVVDTDIVIGCYFVIAVM